MKFTTCIAIFVGLLSATSKSATAGLIMKRLVPDKNKFYDHLMCSEDTPERLLNSSMVEDMNMTVSKCLQICFNLGPYQFAGVEYGVECFCGDNASRKLMKPPTDCKMACGGNKTEMCGGHWRISLYEAVVRLVGGTSRQGRVEIMHNGIWGTVCDDQWDNSDARVVCRMLGLSGGTAHSSAHSSVHFGQGSGKIWLDDVNCNGTEYDLDACSHRGYGVHDCNHREDAGVSCT